MWEVQFHAAFNAEVLAYERKVRVALIAVTKLLADYDLSLADPMRTRSKVQSTPI